MLNAIVSAPARALACSIAARRVQAPPAVAQTPSVRFASAASPVLLTVNVAAETADARAAPQIDSRKCLDLAVRKGDHGVPFAAMMQSDRRGQFNRNCFMKRTVA